MNSPQSATTQTAKTHLSPENRIRMARLFEETSGRLEEMALIVAHTLGMKTKEIRPVFNRPKPRGGAAAAPEVAMQFGGIEIICDPEGNCGCYDYDAGECFPC